MYILAATTAFLITADARESWKSSKSSLKPVLCIAVALVCAANQHNLHVCRLIQSVTACCVTQIGPDGTVHGAAGVSTTKAAALSNPLLQRKPWPSSRHGRHKGNMPCSCSRQKLLNACSGAWALTFSALPSPAAAAAHSGVLPM